MHIEYRYNTEIHLRLQARVHFYKLADKSKLEHGLSVVVSPDLGTRARSKNEACYSSGQRASSARNLSDVLVQKIEATGERVRHRHFFQRTITIIASGNIFHHPNLK